MRVMNHSKFFDGHAEVTIYCDSEQEAALLEAFALANGPAQAATDPVWACGACDRRYPSVLRPYRCSCGAYGPAFKKIAA